MSLSSIWVLTGVVIFEEYPADLELIGTVLAFDFGVFLEGLSCAADVLEFDLHDPAHHDFLSTQTGVVACDLEINR